MGKDGSPDLGDPLLDNPHFVRLELGNNLLIRDQRLIDNRLVAVLIQQDVAGLHYPVIKFYNSKLPPSRLLLLIRLSEIIKIFKLVPGPPVVLVDVLVLIPGRLSLMFQLLFKLWESINQLLYRHLLVEPGVFSISQIGLLVIGINTELIWGDYLDRDWFFSWLVGYGRVQHAKSVSKSRKKSLCGFKLQVVLVGDVLDKGGSGVGGIDIIIIPRQDFNL